MSDPIKLSNVDMQLVTADAFARQGESRRCFEYLERAHVLAQSSTFQHVRVHLLMLIWAIRYRDVPEIAGQLMRIVGAASKAMLVRQSSVVSFLAFASHDAYLAGLGHRAAAIEDSRLLPLTELPLPS